MAEKGWPRDPAAHSKPLHWCSQPTSIIHEAHQATGAIKACSLALLNRVRPQPSEDKHPACSLHLGPRYRACSHGSSLQEMTIMSCLSSPQKGSFWSTAGLLVSRNSLCAERQANRQSRVDMRLKWHLIGESKAAAQRSSPEAVPTLNLSPLY